MDDVIQRLIRFGSILQHHDKLKEWNVQIRGKILLYGPPGTGKTTIARALAKSLDYPLIELQLPQIFSAYLGETGQNVQEAFERAKAHAPSILFLDEFDALARQRSASDEIGEIKRVVNILLQEFDHINFLDHKVLTICATNHQEILDRAVWRRFDEIIHVPLPDLVARRAIFEILMRKIPKEILDFERLARATEGWSGSDIEKLIRRAVIDMLHLEREKLTTEMLLELIENKEVQSSTEVSDFFDQPRQQGTIYPSEMREIVPPHGGNKTTKEELSGFPFILVNYDRDFYQSILSRFPFSIVRSAIDHWNDGASLTEKEKQVIKMFPFLIHEDHEAAIAKLEEAKAWLERQKRLLRR